MTPAITELASMAVPFTVHEYEHAGMRQDYGLEAADRLGLDPRHVFKTLLVTADGEPVVAIVPVSGKLATKALGRAIGSKRVAMCEPAAAERLTGYVRGGISPFGQRQRFATVLDDSALGLEAIYVSGGKRGVDLGIAPGDLVRVLAAITARISA